MGKKIKTDNEYPFDHGEVINYTLVGVSIHPVTTNIQVSFLTQLTERRETAQGFQHEANGDFKTVTEFNGCDSVTAFFLGRRGGPKRSVVEVHGSLIRDT